MKDDKINLDELSQRELLILLHNNVKDLKDDVKEMKVREAEMALKINSLEAKSKVWGSIGGGVVGFFTAGITLFIERLFK
jgi:hypothetical protein